MSYDDGDDNNSNNGYEDGDGGCKDSGMLLLTPLSPLLYDFISSHLHLYTTLYYTIANKRSRRGYYSLIRRGST